MTKAQLKEKGAMLFEAPVVEKPKSKPKAAVVIDHKPKRTAPAKVDADKGRAVAIVPAPTNMLAVIARAAADPAVVPEKMRALLDMQKEIMAEEARIVFNEAFIKMQCELPTIAANGRIIIYEKGTKKVIQSTPYATFNEINKITRPILQANGFALAFATEPGTDGRINVKGILKHARGHQEITVFPLPLETSGSKNNVQGVGSSMSYGKRYAAIALLNLVSEAPEDKDTDGSTKPTATVNAEPTTITAEQEKLLLAAINFCGVGLPRFCQKYGIEKVADLPTNLYNEALNACKNYKPKGA